MSAYPVINQRRIKMSKEMSMEMTPQEKFDAVASLRERIQTDFLELGQVLSDIKRKGTYKLKGYKTFKELVENEYSIKSSVATKLIAIYELYIEEMNLDESELKSIGHDRLDMIRTFVNNAENLAEKEEWIKTAKTTNAADLKEKIQEIRKNAKERQKSFKDILVKQWLETMCTYFNCSRKGLEFKLALYFQDADLETIKQEIKERQVRFEEESEGGHSV
jgi:hypothetical protein